MADDLSGLVGKIQGLAEGAAGEDKLRETGPADAQPTTDVKKSPLVTLEMTEDDIKEWFARIKRSQDRRKIREEKWDILIKDYLPIVSASGVAEDVKMNLHYRDVSVKMAALFYQRPDLILTNKDPGPANNQVPSPMPPGAQPGQPTPPPMSMEDVISIKQAVLNDKLGPEEIDVEELMDEITFDLTAWADIAAIKVGYRCISKVTQQPKLIQDPTAPAMQQGSVLGLSQAPTAPLVKDPTGATEDVPVDLFSEWYMKRISPKKLLLDDALYSSRVDKDSTWIGGEFFMSPARARKPPQEGGLGLTEEQATKLSIDDRRAKYDDDASAENSAQLVHGFEIFCFASAHGSNNPHPRAINQLILVEGIEDKPIAWRAHPDQDFDEQGRLTKDSIDALPILTITLRPLADSPYSPSDAAFTNSHIKQISTWRRQSIQLRDSSVGRYAYDKDAFDTGELDQLKNGTIGEFIGIESGKMANGLDKIIAPVAQAHMTQDDYRGMELLKRDHDEMIGIGATQSGTPEATVQTATQIAQMSTALAARNRKEQSKVVKLYLRAVRMLDQLLMRYATEPDYVLVGGDEAARKPMLWNNKLVSGRYLYEISPDSQMQLDTEMDFRLLLQFYNLSAGDPLANRPYMMKRLARMRRLDPSKVVMPPPPPQPSVVHPNVSVTLKGEDIQTTTGPDGVTQVPVNQVAYDLVMSKPVPPVPAGFAGSLPPHGGAGGAANKHEQSNSGKRENEPGAVNHRATDGV